MATFQEEILRQTGVNLGDGRRYRRGTITSAADAARTDATTARNAALDTVAQGQAIGASRPAAPVIPDSQLSALSSQPSKSPLGDSPVAKAVLAALPSMGAQPGATPSPSGLIDVNAYSGSRYGDSATTPLPGQPAAPGAPQAGYGATRSDPGINVNSYAGSRYDPLFTANNPQAPLDAPDIALAKQLLKLNSGRVPGRVYDDQALAKATPQQIAIEAALLPQRQQQATTDTEAAALQEAFNLMRGGAATPGEAPALDDVTAALGRAPGTPGPAQTTTPDIAAAVAAYVRKGGRDPKRIEEIRQTGEAAAKAAAPGKPVPGSAGYQTIKLPDGGTIVRDAATGEAVSNASIDRPSASATKPAEAEINFDTNISQAQGAIAQLREAIKRNGTWESGVLGNEKDAAILQQVPYQLAIQMAKIADPGSVAREGEVAAAQKYLIPTGFWANRKTALASLDNLESTINGYASSRKAARGGQTAPASPASSPVAPPAIDPAAAAAELARRRAAKK